MDELELGATIRGFAAGQKVFNRYTLKRVLGRGGMGVVWLARDESLDRDVAIKMLPELVAHDPAAVRDLKRETSRSQSLSHPHILRIYDFVEAAQLCGITMELVEGGTLTARRLDQPSEIFSVAEITPWVAQLCDALHYAHTRPKIIHRDLKPANLMLTADGDLKIADFGISASVSDSVSRASQHASSSGTPVYMSPQQMMGERPAVSDDLYAVGATLYELLTGKPPFFSGNIVLQVQNKLPPSIAERRRELGLANADEVPAAWEETIAACLAKDPAARPQNAREIAQRLGLASANAATSQPGHATPPPVSTPVAEHRGRVETSTPTVRSRAPLIAAMIGAVGLAAAGIWYFALHAPEQKRLADIKRLEEQGNLEEAARLRTQQELKDAQARQTLEEENHAQAVITARIDALFDGTMPAQHAETAKAVADYLATAPLRHRGDVESRWLKRSAGWQMHRQSTARGGLRIRTIPDGADVQVGSLTLEKSPVTLRDVRLGTYPVVVRAPGFEEWKGEVEVKENQFVDPQPIRLTRSTGSLRVESVPSGLDFVLETEGGERRGKTPAVLDGIPTGRHALRIKRDGWPETAQNVEVLRQESTTARREFRGAGVAITSDPAGAEVWQDGARLGVTPFTLGELSPGRRQFVVRKEGFGDATREVAIGDDGKVISWHAELESLPATVQRPRFAQGPREMIVALHAVTTGSSNSTTRHETRQVFSEPTSDGAWGRVEQRFLSHESHVAGYALKPDTTFVFQRAADGTWQPQLISGGWSNGVAVTKDVEKLFAHDNPTLWFSGAQWWPGAPARAGETWNVPAGKGLAFFNNVREVRGQITGKVLNVTRNRTDYTADVRYEFDVTGLVPAVNDRFRYKGTATVRVNLGRNYIESCDLSFEQTGKYNFKTEWKTRLTLPD